MNRYAENSKEKKNQSITNSTSQKKNNVNPTFKFVDNRPEVFVQRKLQEMNDTNVAKQNQAIQLGREYDKTLSSQKSRFTEWLIEINRTLGISQEGTSGTSADKKKSNFGWHHILAFMDLKRHGEGKTAPANHGGNLRLGPMKNRLETNDVSGGASIDYSYLPLDQNEDIVLDDYSKEIFNGTIKASDKPSLTSKLTPGTNNKTPQEDLFTPGKEADAFSEWFLESQVKDVLLSKDGITGKLTGAKDTDIDSFFDKINVQFNSLLRTYKYYNKKKEVQITSGIPITDISAGNFDHIQIEIGQKQITASTVIDELLCDQEWIKRGSQGAIQNVATTYKFGLANHEPFTKLVEDAVKNIDLTNYKEVKLAEFKLKLNQEFEIFRDNGRESDNFEQGKEDELITILVENIKADAIDYYSLWNNVTDNKIENQYSKAKSITDFAPWVFPVPDEDIRYSALINADSSNAVDAWANTFVEKLHDWDGNTSLLEEGIAPLELMNIDFNSVKISIDNYEKKLNIRNINKDRVEKNKLPQKFLEKIHIDIVKGAVAYKLSEAPQEYLSTEKEALTLDDIKEELRNSVGGHFNIIFKRLKGIEKDLEKRRSAFGPHFSGFIDSTKWNIINSTEIPTDVEGTSSVRWEDLDGKKEELYAKWLETQNVVGCIATFATIERFSQALP